MKIFDCAKMAASIIAGYGAEKIMIQLINSKEYVYTSKTQKVAMTIGKVAIVTAVSALASKSVSTNIDSAKTLFESGKKIINSQDPEKEIKSIISEKLDLEEKEIEETKGV